MKTKFLIIPSALLISIIGLFSCDKDTILPKDGTFDYGKICTGKSILEYLDLEHLQSEHKFLYDNYIANFEDENILINFESSKGHYSLRKKDNDMDDSIIPNDPSFDPYEYSSDDVMESILNQDGMVIIGGELYLWDDGCIIMKTHFSCSNYQDMIKLHDYLRLYSSSPTPQLNIDISNLRSKLKITEINKCKDVRYDLETYSEDNLQMIEDSLIINDSRSSGCGFNAFLEINLISNDNNTKKARLRITANAIQSPGATPYYGIYLANVNNNNQVKIISGALPNYVTNSDWYTSLSQDGNGIVYPGSWVEVEVDYNQLNQLDVKLRGLANGFTGNSCLSTDEIIVNLNCLVFISKKPLNALNGTWQFEINGVDIASSGYTVTWDFGDGSPNQSFNGQQGSVYSYAIPCSEIDYCVTATIRDYSGCINPISVCNILVGDPCKMDKRRVASHFTAGGKCVRLIVKIRDKYFSGGTSSVLKNKFKWRKPGTKTIKTTGTIYVEQGNNCVPINLSSQFGLNPESDSGKNKLVQKLDDGNHYSFDVNLPYQVEFTHSDGAFTPHILMFNVPCSN